MKDYRDHMSRDSKFDDTYEWRSFVRDTKLPHGTFGKRRSWDDVVFVVCMILLGIGLFLANIAP